MISDYMLDPPSFDGEPQADAEPIAACRACNAAGWQAVWVIEAGARRRRYTKCSECNGTGHTLPTEDVCSDWFLTPAEAAPEEPVGFWTSGDNDV